MMRRRHDQQTKRIRRSRRSRSRVRGTADRPRFSVFRSNRRLWVQLLDDQAGRTLVSASDRELPRKRGKKKAPDRQEAARWVGKAIAEKARAKKILAARFDRGRYRYHGLVKAIADGAREGGLTF